MKYNNRRNDEKLHALEMRLINIFNAIMDLDLVVPYITVDGKRMETINYYEHLNEEFNKAKSELYEYKLSFLSK